jgi:hypothetical protein
LQILGLPEGTGDDRPPFVLVVDQHQPLRYIQGIGEEPQVVDEFAGIAEQIGARAVLVFAEPVDIPGSEAPPAPDDCPEERAGTTEIVHAHERTRLDLCAALLVSGDTTWRKLVETVTERQRELAGLYRQLDRVRELPDYPDLMDSRQEHPAVWKHGYQCGVLAAKTAARNERATAAKDGG